MENRPQSAVGEDGGVRNIPVISDAQNLKPRKIHLNPRFLAAENYPLINGVNNQFHVHNQSNKYNETFALRFPPPHPLSNNRFQPHHSLHHRFPPHRLPANHPFHSPMRWGHAPHRMPWAPFQSNGDFYRPSTPQQNYFAGFNSESQTPNPWLQSESAPCLGPPTTPNVVGEWQEGQPYPEQPDPVPGPSYYNAFNECSNELGSSYADASSNFHLNTDDGQHDMCVRRSRSRRSHSSSGHSRTRSHSAGSRRARSLSSHYRHSRSHSSSSSKFSPCSRRPSELSRSGDGDSVWNSNDEVNSDSDLDLSKSLSLLSESVSDSKTLLRNTFKCLGNSKFESMMPTECSNYSKRRLFRMFESILEGTDSEILIKIMEGKRVQSESPSSSVTHVKDSSDATNCDGTGFESDEEPKRKLHRKKLKRKKKKRKKSKRQETETEDESLESDTEVAQPDPPTCNRQAAVPSSTASIAQQSLLELIHIEYKTKAINVMLKNLGVASDITNLVSNALTAEGSNAAQILAALRSSTIDDVGQNREDKSSPGANLDLSVITPPDSYKPIESHAFSNATEIPKSTDISACDLSTLKSTSDDSSLGTTSPLALVAVAESNELEVDIGPAVLEDEAELFKEIDNDVLDLRVGANDNLKLPDDV